MSNEFCIVNINDFSRLVVKGKLNLIEKREIFDIVVDTSTSGNVKLLDLLSKIKVPGQRNKYHSLVTVPRETILTTNQHISNASELIFENNRKGQIIPQIRLN